MTELEAFARDAAKLVNDKLAADRATLALSQPSSKPLDIGRCPMTESPLFGGDPQLDLF